MSRVQLLIFASLLAISFLFIFLNQNADLYLSNRLSEVLLFPVKLIFSYFQYLDVSQKKIDCLEADISKLQIENQILKKSLNSLMAPDTITNLRLRVLKANVIGRDPQNFNGFLYIDKGYKDGLTVNAPVVFQNKIIGRIKSLSENTGIVETIENPDFALSAVDVRSGIYGIAKKKDQLNFEYIKINDDVNSGDSIYTSGLSENIPGGLIIGTVSTVKEKDDLFFKEVIIEPALSINKLNYVYVIY
uniref:Cell shape-determining protein MreC n=1 Tax=candidate division WOR-3 bacterium TaxID=2052148 RepID=A0A7C6EMY2_UNCW3